MRIVIEKSQNFDEENLGDIEQEQKQATGAEFLLPKLLDDFFMGSKKNNRKISQEEFIEFINNRSKV